MEGVEGRGVEGWDVEGVDDERGAVHPLEGEPIDRGGVVAAEVSGGVDVRAGVRAEAQLGDVRVVAVLVAGAEGSVVGAEPVGLLPRGEGDVDGGGDVHQRGRGGGGGARLLGAGGGGCREGQRERQETHRERRGRVRRATRSGAPVDGWKVDVVRRHRAEDVSEPPTARRVTSMVLAVTTTLEVAGLPPVRLREERDNEDVPLRTGCRVWSCARLLSAWLASACASGGSGGGADGADDADAGRGRSFAPRVAGRDVLELGAGTGAVGLVCALLGARSVTMTDRDEATLALMHANARLNGHYDPNASCEVSARALDWGDLATYHARAYNLIVAADVLYLPEHCDALPAAAAAHLAPGGQLVVACGLRRAGLMERLVDAIRARGLRPVVHRDALVLRDDDPRDAATITAAEHAHDGAQIAAAGG